MTETPKLCYQFDDFLLDPNEGVLSRAGRRVALTPTALRVLLTLVENNGRLLPAEELRTQVWGESIVEDANLDVQLSHVRKALGDNAKAPRYIHLTRAAGAGKGYRFTADIHELTEFAPDAPEADADTPKFVSRPGLYLRPGLREIMDGLDAILYACAEALSVILAGLADGGGKILRGLLRGWLLVLLLVLAVWLGWLRLAWNSLRAQPLLSLGLAGIIVAAAGFWLWRRWRRLKRCLAVLPFESHHPPPGLDDFAQGLADTFAHKLAERPRLAQIRENNGAVTQDVAQFCRELGAYSALKSVLDWDGGAVRVTLKLVHRDGKTLLWSGQFTAALAAPLFMQESLSTQMAEAFWRYRADAA